MGFDIHKFVSKVSEDRKCALCHLVLDNPVKTPCSHIFCSGCILPWVLRSGACPFTCCTLTTCDLDNVLPLRELVQNMKVVCDYKDNGCNEQVRLADLKKHTQECSLRTTACRNKGCGVQKPFKHLPEHEVHECDFRPVGICKKGCDIVLLHNNELKHDCIESLKSRMTNQEEHIGHLESEVKNQTLRLKQREKELLSKVTFLQKKLQIQTMKYVNEIRNYESQMKNNNNCANQCGEDRRLALVLERSGGTLGFNIMGGYVTENNNNNNNNNNKEGMVTEGIIVSKVMDGGPAQKRGLKGHDQIVKVNGRDLSQASHEEAVEAFRTAEEPIVVEVLRRVNKNKMKTRPIPAMVSIGTQTEEDIYGYNRPPTPPPAFYPFPYSGLLEPASRRPLVFSQSTEMGLTDIEMAQFDYDDPYYDDRQYEVEYEEVVLQRPSEDDKLGLTLCYGATEEGITDIFVGEIDPYSVAAKDGRIREGDQIVQINGVDVHSREQAIKLFSEKNSDITLLLARPQLQFDDGFMEEHNVVLDELQMEYLEKHHHDNMQIMASMLARGHHFDEEGGTTDTGTTNDSSHKHEKDSGVGRTDESTKNDESSEQDVFDNESMMGTRKSGSSKGDNADQNYSNESFVSNGDTSYGVPETDCDKFREVLEHRCDKNNLNRIGSPRKDCRKVSESTEGSIDRELAQVNKEMEGIQLECQEMVNNHLQNKGAKDSGSRSSGSETYKTPRSVPRMGTRLDYVKTGVSPSPDSSDSVGRRDTPPTPKMGQVRYGKSNDGGNASTSAYNTGESCRSTPLTLELNIASDEGEKGFKNSMLCLATTATTMTPPVLSQSDTEKQTQTPARSQNESSDENYMTIGSISNKNITKMDNNNKNNKKLENVERKLQSGESLQDLYMQYADVMYTNRANLEHTMQIQQKLFQQQMEQKGTHTRRHKSSSPSSRHSSVSSKQNGVSGNQSPNDSPVHGQNTGQTTQESGDQMEWVVKRRPDGTRYITRRPVRSKMLKERAKKISEERCGMTTDDDAMSELKTGRYWTKEERKRHLEKYRDQKRKRELMVKAKMETLKEADEKKDIVELSHRKMNKSKGKKVFDDFVTVQEMLAHGSKTAEGKTYNPLLSVTTV